MMAKEWKPIQNGVVVKVTLKDSRSFFGVINRYSDGKYLVEYDAPRPEIFKHGKTSGWYPAINVTVKK